MLLKAVIGNVVKGSNCSQGNSEVVKSSHRSLEKSDVVKGSHCS